jgi:hypothetical protein
VDTARALLGMVSRSEAVPVAVLEEFVRTVLDAEPIAKLALQVMDPSDSRRLARAIALAGAVIEADGRRAPLKKLQG